MRLDTGTIRAFHIQNARLAYQMTTSLLAVLLAGCVALPSPFQKTNKNESVMSALVTLGMAVAVERIEGAPAVFDAALRKAVAEAAQERDIAAAASDAYASNYRLVGSIPNAPDLGRHLTVTWALYPPGGKLMTRFTVKRELGPVGQPVPDTDITALAEQTADRLAIALAGSSPQNPSNATVAPPAASTTPIRLFVGPLSGAPGDGNETLRSAMALVLGETGVPTAGDIANAQLVLTAQITVTPAGSDIDQVSIVWLVNERTGNEIGRIAQENAVPSGSLDGAWGTTSYHAAYAAAEGITALIQEIASQPHE